MLDQTKYLCSPKSFFLFSSEQIPFMQLRLNEHVSISRMKDIAAKMPLQNTRVCPRRNVVILISQEHGQSSDLSLQCQKFYHK